MDFNVIGKGAIKIIPPMLALPNLELIEIQETEVHNTLDLSFLRNCPKLKEIKITASWFKKISLPSLENRHILRIEISFNSFLRSIVSPSPWYCPNLKEIEIHSNDLEAIDLSFLQDCHGLKELHLESNRITALDLSPLLSCQQLKTLGLFNNRLQELDLSPLKDHPTLEKVDLSRNKFEEIDLTPLHTCPKIQEVNLENTPVFSREIKKFQ